MIKKLEYTVYPQQPTMFQIADKVNEIIDFISNPVFSTPKDKPMKVIGKPYEYQKCPRCGNEWKGWDFYSDEERPKYCDQCGQALDWDASDDMEDEEEFSASVHRAFDNY